MGSFITKQRQDVIFRASHSLSGTQSNLILHPTKLSGLVLVNTQPIGDDRGAFARWFCQDELAALLGTRSILQINYSRTGRVGALRGMHFQDAPHAEMKLIRCLRGRVFDVAVDLRKDSPTVFKWHAEELSGDNQRMIVIPEGFAHGFQVLEPDSELLYLHTAMYQKNSEGAVRYDDPLLGIHWPLPITDISLRDQNHRFLDHSFQGV